MGAGVEAVRPTDAAFVISAAGFGALYAGGTVANQLFPQVNVAIEPARLMRAAAQPVLISTAVASAAALAAVALLGDRQIDGAMAGASAGAAIGAVGGVAFGTHAAYVGHKAWPHNLPATMARGITGTACAFIISGVALGALVGFAQSLSD